MRILFFVSAALWMGLKYLFHISDGPLFLLLVPIIIISSLAIWRDRKEKYMYPLYGIILFLLTMSEQNAWDRLF